MEEEGIKIDEAHFKVVTKNHTLDRKAANMFNATGGSYCNLCLLSKEEARDPEKVKAGMPITRSLLHTHEILEFLCDEEGEIKIASGDYGVRFGVMGLPINQVDCKDVQVLHTSLRTMDTFAEACCCLSAGTKIWTSSEYKNRNIRFVKQARDNIRDELRKKDLAWDIPDSTGHGGTTTTGNTVRKIIHSKSLRDVFTDGINNTDDRAAAVKFGNLLSQLIRVMSSSSEVDLVKYKKSCDELYNLLLTDLSFVSITPTLHKLLAHSAELIEGNGGKGLKNLSEEGLEGCQGELRKIRINLSRKSAQKLNLFDCLGRLWIGSGMYIVYEII